MGAIGNGMSYHPPLNTLKTLSSIPIISIYWWQKFHIWQVQWAQWRWPYQLITSAMAVQRWIQKLKGKPKWDSLWQQILHALPLYTIYHLEPLWPDVRWDQWLWRQINQVPIVTQYEAVKYVVYLSRYLTWLERLDSTVLGSEYFGYWALFAILEEI